MGAMQPRVFRASATIAVALVAGFAFGQGALDAGLQVGSKTNTAAKQEDFRSRNLVVTGDVAAGRGFRGSVGYTAEGDFRGATGSDASIDFRRNTALSNPVLAANSANAAASFNVGRDSVSNLEFRRDFAGASTRGAAGSVSDPALTRARLDRLSTQMSSSQQRLRDGEGVAMARYQSGETDTGNLVASTVRGVKKQRDRDMLKTEPLSLYEAARLREDLRSGLLRMDAVGPREANPFQVAAPQDSVNVSSVRDAKPISRGTQAMQPAEGRQSSYDRIIRQMRENWMARVAGREAPKAAGEGAPTPTDTDRSTEMRSAYDQLREQLGAAKQPVAKDKDAKPADAKDDAKQSGKDGKITVGNLTMSVDEYATVLKHGTTLDAFGDEGKDRIDELLREGQRAMHEGNGFTAEKRFEIALLMKPGDARATAGLLHCQISANLPGSASITLRSLFTDHPEMMDVRYGEQAMPPRARIERALASTRERVREGRDTQDYGLLQAYLGHLLGDEAAVREGLSFVKGRPEDDTMRGLLERLWLSPGAKPGIEAAPAPAPSKNP